MRGLVVAASLLAAGALHAADARLKAGTFDPPRRAPAFSITGTDGGELTLERYRGKVVALAFGYSHCPEICPTTLARLAKAHKLVRAQGFDFQGVYVTVDPERDSPEALRTFLANFDPTFVGGTGAAPKLQALYKDYGVVATKWPGKQPGSYGIEHSTFILLIDGEGRLRAMVPYGKSAEDIAHDAMILLGR